MSAGTPAEFDRWLIAAVAERFHGAKVTAVDALKGDASSRRFWRVSLSHNDIALDPEHAPDGAPRHQGHAPPDSRGRLLSPATAIAIDLGPDDLPLYARALKLVAEPLAEPPWINVQRFLASIGSAVPEIFAADVRARMLLVEDVGEVPLFEAALHGDGGDLYRLAADELLVLHLEGTRQIDDRCIASQVAYDERLFRWELAQFVDYGIGEVSTTVQADAIAPELHDLEIGRAHV